MRGEALAVRFRDKHTLCYVTIKNNNNNNRKTTSTAIVGEVDTIGRIS